MSERTTIFALSSGRPPAAVSIIRISGPAAHHAAECIAGSLPEARTAALRSLRDPRSGALLDQALVLRFDAPASSTFEDVVELHCHGGRAVVDALLETLGSIRNLMLAAPGEFSRRAFENGRIDLTEAEGLADLIEAETETQRKAALALARGGLRQQIAVWSDRLLTLSARAELAIDYDDEDEMLDPELLAGCAALAADLRAWLARPRTEPLKDGVRVVIAGPPNAGKSSLLNAITEQDRAIVTAMPGTTRDSIDVPLSLGGIAIRLTDTAGLRTATDPVEAIGVDRAARQIEEADVLLWLGDPDDAPPHRAPVLVHAKADLLERGHAPSGSIPVSSVSGEGLGELLRRVEALVQSFTPGEDGIALNRRQAGELSEAAAAVGEAVSTRDVVFMAEGLRVARAAFDRMTGKAGMEDVLDELFGRFCLGK